ncbi:MAG: ABC transporter substrate-binding protein [Chloroflexi bacterium]|nr:ABC transporter substrate-binding protein [Chloroflexota bacterium]
MHLRVAILVCLVALLGVAAGCRAAGPVVTPTTPSSIAAPPPEASAALFLFTATDSNGRAVTFARPPERIVAYDAAVVEILFAIGEGRRVVGTHTFVTYPPETAAVPKVGDAFTMNLEKVAELKPDLVFVFFDRFLPDLEKLGLKVLYLKTRDESLQEVADDIRMWGRITGAVGQAEQVARALEARVRGVEEAVAPIQQGPRIFHDVGDLWTPGPQTTIGRVYALLKAQNIAFDMKGYQQIDPEVLVARDPEVIVTSAAGRDRFLSTAAFQNVAAVRNGRVLVANPDLLGVQGPRLMEGVEELAKLLYPGLFP